MTCLCISRVWSLLTHILQGTGQAGGTHTDSVGHALPPGCCSLLVAALCWWRSLSRHILISWNPLWWSYRNTQWFCLFFAGFHAHIPTHFEIFCHLFWHLYLSFLYLIWFESLGPVGLFSFLVAPKIKSNSNMWLLWTWSSPGQIWWTVCQVVWATIYCSFMRCSTT